MTLESKNQTCHFCQTIFSPSEYQQHANDRLSFCPSVCMTRQTSSRVEIGKRSPQITIPRFKSPIDNPQINYYMKGLFEAFVIEIERSPSFYGNLNFDKLYQYIKSRYQYLTETEYITLLEILNQYEQRWGEYVNMVLNETRYTEISSSSKIKKEFKTPSDWAAAIRNLMRILSDANHVIKSQLELYLSPAKIEEKKKLCHRSSVAHCNHPCKIKTKMGLKYCSYPDLPLPVKKS